MDNKIILVLVLFLVLYYFKYKLPFTNINLPNINLPTMEIMDKMNTLYSKTNKIALITHVGNMKVFEQILLDYPKFFNNDNIDIYFSCNTNKDYEILLKNFPDEKVFLYENRGMDIGPFLLTIKYLSENELSYDFYIKIHTKTNPRWRNQMLIPIYKNLPYFLTNKPTNTMMYGCKEWVINNNFTMNYYYILDIIKRNYPEHTEKFLNYCTGKTKQCKTIPYFVAGTIFVFNDKYFDLLKEIKNFNHEFMILETGYIVNDPRNPRKTHSWEYLFGYLNYLNDKNITVM